MKEKKTEQKKIITGIVIFALLLLAILLIANLKQWNQWIGSALIVLRPMLIGLAASYLCNPFFRFFERKVFFKLQPPSLRRALSLICTYLAVLLIIALVLLLIIPHLVDSVIRFASNYDSYVTSAINQVNKHIVKFNELLSRIPSENVSHLELWEEGALREKITGFFGGNGKDLMATLQSLDVKQITDILGNVLGILTDTLFGLFFSIYLLSTKEKRYAQIMKVRRALFSDAVNARITRFCTVADRSFGRFLEGKLLDSLIIGILAYIAFLILQVPYALLLATFIGITNIIPIIGPFIGAIPSAFILLLSAPEKVIPFLIVVIVLQQLDSNIIGPKILGNNTGVSSLCVMIAITVMGSLWGLVGMLLGVPLFATILELTDEHITTRLQQKGLPSGVANYYSDDSIVDPATNAHITTDKTVQKLERRALRISKKQESGETLSRRERWTLNFYNFLSRHHVIIEMTDEERARYSAEEATEQARREAEEYLQQRHSITKPQDVAPEADGEI